MSCAQQKAEMAQLIPIHMYKSYIYLKVVIWNGNSTTSSSRTVVYTLPKPISSCLIVATRGPVPEVREREKERKRERKREREREREYPEAPSRKYEVCT